MQVMGPPCDIQWVTMKPCCYFSLGKYMTPWSISFEFYTVLSKEGPGKGHSMKAAADNLDRASVSVGGGKTSLVFTSKAL